MSYVKEMDDFISKMGCWYYSDEWNILDIETLCRIVPKKSFDLLVRKHNEIEYNDQSNFAMCVLGMFLIKGSGVSLDE